MPSFEDLGVDDANATVLNRDGEHSVLTHGRWKELIPTREWNTYLRAIREFRKRDMRFAFGGAFAVATYTGKWRDTKDMDVYIRPHDREQAMAALTAAGMHDYFDRREYDRSWIYRAYRAGVIVDAIWSMANHRTEVDDDWLERGPLVEFGPEMVRVVPPEELIWSKLYVLQRDRSDWPDVLNIIHAAGPDLDWHRLAARLDDDLLLLDGVLAVYRWLCPRQAERLPSWLSRSNHAHPVGELDPCRRVKLLDSRPWFRAAEDKEKPC